MSELSNRMENRIQLLVLRNDLLSCPADLHMPMLCACIGAKADDAGLASFGPDQAREAWFEFIDSAIDDVGKLVSQERLDRITTSAARFGWSDPRPGMTANVGMRP